MLNPIPQNPSARPCCSPDAIKPVPDLRPPQLVIPIGVFQPTNNRGIGLMISGIKRGRMMIGNADPSPVDTKLQNISRPVPALDTGRPSSKIGGAKF